MKGLYPAAGAGAAPRVAAIGGRTDRPVEKMPRAFRFRPGIKLPCCCVRIKRKSPVNLSHTEQEQHNPSSQGLATVVLESCRIFEFRIPKA